MDWINYHHLLYFWTVANEGSVTGAAKKLRLSQPTVSSQLRTLEDSLGEKLFERQGRGLRLTDAGHLVHNYANEIFGLGQELKDALRGHSPRRPRLHVGVSITLPKLVTYRLLSPILQLDPPVQLVCDENRTDHLLANLSVDGLDLVIADQPLGSGANIRAFTHSLGESDIAFFGEPSLAARFREGFPKSLDGAPLLLPTHDTPVRRALDYWFEELGVRPRIIAEFADTALLKVFGEYGAALMIAPTMVENEVIRRYGVDVVGRTSAVKERYYAISVERRIKHPAVIEIIQESRRQMAQFEGTD